MKIQIIMERHHGADLVAEVWADEAKADKRIEELLKLHPRSDGYDLVEWDVFE